MQVNLHKIDIYTILQVIESGQKIGTLLVNSDRCDSRQSQVWLIFFLHGQRIYATYGDTSLSRLKDYLHIETHQIHLDINASSFFIRWNTQEALHKCWMISLNFQRFLNAFKRKLIPHLYNAS